MTSAATNPSQVKLSFLRRRPYLCSSLCALLLLLPISLVVIDHFWPYRYRNVEPTLESVFASQIKIDTYHRTYFPYPGFVADGITLRRNSAPDLPPVGSIQHIRVEGRWLDLFLLRRQIHTVFAEGLQIVIPPVGSRANQEDFPPGSANDFTGPTVLIQHLDIRDSQLDILLDNGGRYTFPIHRLLIANLQQNSRIDYTVDMQNARPSGRILSTGTFGPLFANQLQSTPVSGNVTFTNVALNEIGSLRGTLNSSVRFQGTLASIEVFANSSIPDFAVTDARPTPITVTSSGTVSALNGDISLRSIDVLLGHTTLHAQGTIAGSPKLTQLDLSVTRGRAEDLLHPFLVHASPIAGPIQLHSHATLAPATNGATFLQRLTLTGAFDIPSQRLTNPSTETSLTNFSQRAQGLPNPTPADPAADVLSSLNGDVTIRDGVAHTSRLALQFPGASILVAGTFNLHSSAVAMQGNLRMQSDISHVTTGFKSFLLKPLAPFFRHKPAGAVVPIAITGVPHHYKINQNILHF
jgi:uncharacterized protein involved in outer membrane biogenesis